MSISNIIAASRSTIVNYTLRPLIKRMSESSGVAASILLTSRNNASYLKLTLSALERQLLPPRSWEVIVFDMASQDNTSGIVQYYIHNKRMRLTYECMDESCSRVSATNQALEIAKGSILVFLEDN